MLHRQGRRQEFIEGVSSRLYKPAAGASARYAEFFKFGFHSAHFSDFEKRYNKPILCGTLASYRLFLIVNCNEKIKTEAKNDFLVQHVTCYNCMHGHPSWVLAGKETVDNRTYRSSGILYLICKRAKPVRRSSPIVVYIEKKLRAGGFRAKGNPPATPLSGEQAPSLSQV